MATVRHYSADGATLITNQDFGTLVSGVIEVDSTRRKFALENIADRPLGEYPPFSSLLLTIQAVGDNDGAVFYYTATDPNGTLSKPWGPTDSAPDVTVSLDAGYWGSTGTKGVVVTALNATGETVAGGERTFNITDLSQIAAVDWEQTPGATSYRVYFTDTPGDYSAAKYVTVSPGATTTVDLDGIGTPGSPPSANTTGGAGPGYGTPPAIGSFSQVDKSIGALAIGQQWFYYAVVRVTPGASAIGNRRAVRVLPREA